MEVKVLLVDDHKIVREGLRHLLEMQQDIKVVGEAENGRVAVRMVSELSPDVVVMDVVMPRLNGIEATRRICAQNKELKVVALSMRSERRFVIEMFQAGASGYLLKDAAADELVQAIRTVMAGKLCLSPQIANVDVEELSNSRLEAACRASLLSQREREVLQLLAEGLPTKQIAASLSVSIKTVEMHRSNIMSKLKLHSVAELTRWALREGITFLDT